MNVDELIAGREPIDSDDTMSFDLEDLYLRIVREREATGRTRIGRPVKAVLVAAAGLAVAIALALAFVPGAQSAAASLLGLGHAAQNSGGQPTLQPGQFFYQETVLKDANSSIVIHGTRITAVSGATNQQWIGPPGAPCHIRSVPTSVAFIGNSEATWMRLGSPPIGAPGVTDFTQKGGCGVPNIPDPSTDPATLLNQVRGVIETDSGVAELTAPSYGSDVFNELVGLLMQGAPSPELRSAIVADLSDVNGVVDDGPTIDPLGRPGEAFTTEVPAQTGNDGFHPAYRFTAIIDLHKDELLTVIDPSQGLGSDRPATTSIVAQGVVNSISSTSLVEVHQVEATNPPRPFAAPR
jgi:hypothetical protein